MTRTKVSLCVFLLVFGLPFAGCLDNLTGSDSDDVTDVSTVIEGCTDTDAANYDSTATDDDGSCMIATAKQFIDTLFGANPFSAVLNPSDDRSGIDILHLRDMYDDGWSSSSRSVMVDGSTGAMEMSHITISDGGIENFTWGEPGLLQIVKQGGDVAYRNSGGDDVRTSDGTYVPADETRRTDFSHESELAFVMEELELDRQPTCKEIYGPQTLGTWPACYEDSTTSASSSTSGRGGGDGWAVGMYEYQACAIGGGTWINTDPDPIANPNVGYCVWSFHPLGVQSVFVDAANGEHIGHIEGVIASAEYTYTEDSRGFTMEFDFANEGLRLAITLDEDQRLLAFESIMSFEGEEESYALHYYVAKPMKDDNGNDVSGLEKAATGNGALIIDNDDRMITCECGGWDGTTSNTIMVPFNPNGPQTQVQVCATACQNIGITAPAPSTGTPTFDAIRDRAISMISEGDSTSRALSLKFVCDDGAKIWLGQTQDGTEDCAGGEDEVFDSESGLTFEVADSQVKRPLISSFDVRFISDESTNYSNASALQTMSLVMTEESSGTDARAADNMTSTIYTDSDGDGRISPGDRIVLTFSSDVVALFIDRNVNQYAALQLDDNREDWLGGLTEKDMSCEEQDLCTARWTYFDSNLGAYQVNTWCELRPEGYDCDGNPTAVEEE